MAKLSKVTRQMLEDQKEKLLQTVEIHQYQMKIIEEKILVLVGTQNTFDLVITQSKARIKEIEEDLNDKEDNAKK